MSPGVPFNVTPAAGATVICPAPVCSKSIDVPIGYAVVEFAGIVTVNADAELHSINVSLKASPPVDKLYAAVAEFIVVLEGTASFVCVPSVKAIPDAATVTVPVNVGDASGAFAARSDVRFAILD